MLKMDFTDINQVVLFLIFFIPGFISLKVYDLFIPSERRDFSKSFFDAVAYSAINYAFWSWLIILMDIYDVYTQHHFWYAVAIVIIIFASPVLLPILYLEIVKWKPISTRILHPHSSSWDYVFSKRKEAWVIVHLKDGERIGGIFSTESFASSYPAKEQIYLEDIWKLDDNGAFEKSLNNSLLILNDEIMGIEFVHQRDD